MEKPHYLGIRFKIILYTILSVVAVGFFSNLFLYQYMQDIIGTKAERIDSLYASTVAAQLDYSMDRALALAYYCTNTDPISESLRYSRLDMPGAVRSALTAQDNMNSYLRTSRIDSYVNRLMIFNDSGVCINAFTNRMGTPGDFEKISASHQFLRWKSGEWTPFDQVFPSMDVGGGDCFALFSNVYAFGSNVPVGYVYIELNPAIATDILIPYNAVNLFFLRTPAGDRLTTKGTADLLSVLPKREEEGASFYYDDSHYAIKRYPLRSGALTLESCVNLTQLETSNQDILFSVVTVILMITLITIFVTALLTRYITDPINRIVEKINRIVLNDYAFTPTLEQMDGEMGEVGARLNELGMGIEKLLEETIAHHDERAEIEMALLQSQVNPHFLYNTLNSIHWMAVVQKNPGIEKMVHSLVNLLKNVSKGVSDKITLAEELALLDDYINIQSMRYMGAFDYVCRVPEALKNYKIVKFTLQPLVENAIFHGVVPKGTFGSITIDAREEKEYLVITVADDGVGMDPRGAAELLKKWDRPDKSSMSGIGVANVHRRLKLVYGQKCGLSVESEKDAGTIFSVRILKERGAEDVPYSIG